jgi:single-stranded DNA-binding protein
MKIHRLRRRAHARWFLVKHDVQGITVRQLTAHSYALAEHPAPNGAKRVTSHDSVDDALAYAGEQTLEGWRPTELVDLDTGDTVTNFAITSTVSIAQPVPPPHKEQTMSVSHTWPLRGRLAGNPRTRKNQGPEDGVWVTLLSPCEDGDDLVFTCYADGAMGANIAQLCRKDTHVLIEGRPRQRRFTDDGGRSRVVTTFDIVDIGPSLSHLPVSTKPRAASEPSDDADAPAKQPRRRLRTEGIKRPAAKTAS